MRILDRFKKAPKSSSAGNPGISLQVDNLEKEASVARLEGRVAEAQQLRLRAAWLRITQDPLSTVPDHFEVDDFQHILLIDVIREQYSNLLGYDTSEFVGLMYRPTSMLMFPKAHIAMALDVLLDVVQGKQSSPLLADDLVSEDLASTIANCRELLNDFVDVPSERIPRNRHANLAFGIRFSETGSIDEATSAADEIIRAEEIVRHYREQRATGSESAPGDSGSTHGSNLSV